MVALTRVATCGGSSTGAITSPRETSMSVARCSATLSGALAASRASPSTSMALTVDVLPPGRATTSSPTRTVPLAMRPASARTSAPPSS